MNNKDIINKLIEYNFIDKSQETRITEILGDTEYSSENKQEFFIIIERCECRIEKERLRKIQREIDYKKRIENANKSQHKSFQSLGKKKLIKELKECKTVREVSDVYYNFLI